MFEKSQQMETKVPIESTAIFTKIKTCAGSSQGISCADSKFWSSPSSSSPSIWSQNDEAGLSVGADRWKDAKFCIIFDSRNHKPGKTLLEPF